MADITTAADTLIERALQAQRALRKLITAARRAHARRPEQVSELARLELARLVALHDAAAEYRREAQAWDHALSTAITADLEQEPLPI